MENEITAHKAGKITELPISVGASVATGDTLAVITAPRPSSAPRAPVSRRPAAAAAMFRVRCFCGGVARPAGRVVAAGSALSCCQVGVVLGQDLERPLAGVRRAVPGDDPLGLLGQRPQPLQRGSVDGDRAAW